jgi:hypothetical protein
MMSFDPEKITFFGKTDARGQGVPFGIKAKDRQRHMYVVGKTGMGKSTLLENMAAQDIRNGEGMAFIDPHGSAAETLLNYVPEHRVKDVVYFAPFDLEHPISFNVMEDVGPDKRHLVVSGLMSTFKKIWVDAWSARMEYILTNTLLALIEYPDTTLLSVNRMLADKRYREQVVNYVKDPAVKAYWVNEFASYTDRFTADALPAIQNKIGQFTGNPLIRNIIGQPHSSFDIRQLMDERKILIMNLSKGLIGETNANLLGSMLTTRIYLAAMSRADLPVETMKRMPNFYFYVDEFQSFANATFANILSEARKYHLNLIIAHQYIDQMEEDVRSAVFGNVGTTIAFRVGPFDAEVLETVFAPRFMAVDLVNLGFAQIYLTLMIDGIGSQPFSAQTLPPIQMPPVSYRDMVIASSQKIYAKSRTEVEDMVSQVHTVEQSEVGAAPRTGMKSAGGAGAKSGFQKTGSFKKSGAAPQPYEENQPKTDKKSSDDKPRLESTISEKRESSPKSPSTQKVDDLRQVLAKIAGKDEVEKTKPAVLEDTKEKSEEKRDKNKPASTEKKAKSERPVNNSFASESIKVEQPTEQPNKVNTAKDDLRAMLQKISATAEQKTDVPKSPPIQIESKPKTESNNSLQNALAAVITQVETKSIITTQKETLVSVEQEKPQVLTPIKQPTPTEKRVTASVQDFTQPISFTPVSVRNREPKNQLDVDKIKRMLRQSDRDRSPFN